MKGAKRWIEEDLLEDHDLICICLCEYFISKKGFRFDPKNKGMKNYSLIANGAAHMKKPFFLKKYVEKGQIYGTFQ